MDQWWPTFICLLGTICMAKKYLQKNILVIKKNGQEKEMISSMRMLIFSNIIQVAIHNACTCTKFEGSGLS